MYIPCTFITVNPLKHAFIKLKYILKRIKIQPHTYTNKKTHTHTLCHDALTASV